ncbi:MAG: TIGR02302 family protein [Alphaproteobacteria bacterium]
MRRAAGPVEALAAAARRRLWLARVALLWERLWPALWPAVFIAGLFLAASLLDLWALVPGWLHAALLLLLGGGFVVALARGMRGVRMPGEAAAVRRLERESGLGHRPLNALRDRPAIGAGDRTSQGLWQAHLERVARSARRLRIGVPSPGLARRDPLGVRAALLLVLVVAAVAAGGDAESRLVRALMPDFSGLGSGGPAELTLWITPPAYTGAAPIFLAAGAAGAAAETAMQPDEITAPSGSAVLARVHGGRAAPRLIVDDDAIEFATVDAANFELRETLSGGRRLAVSQDGEELAVWPLTVIVDQPPLIEFVKPPGRTQRSALRLDYLAEDDYGLTSVEAIVRRVDDPEQWFSLNLPLPRARNRAAEETSFHDLTPHPWAGIEVTITLGTVDAIGQRGTSEAVPTVLPERIFNHPVARALVEQRKALTLDPSKRAEVSHALHEISRFPERFFDDLTVFLGLRTARWRLLYDRADDAVSQVQDLLWDLALTIEDGPIALAERELREAQQALLDALSSDAPDEEIERLIDELLASLDEFLDALLDQAASQRDMDPGLEDEMLQAVQREELRDLVERIRELYRTGARDAARQLLAQLQEILENLRAGRFAGMDRQGMSQGQAMLDELERLVDQQQRLLDQTFRWSQGSGEGSEGGPVELGFAQQEALRRRLGELMLGWGEMGQQIPRPLGRAERAMREAGRALTDNQPGQAVGPQTRAIDQLQQGAQAMLEALLEQYGGAPPRPGNNMGLFGERDPLGRGVMGRAYQDDGRTRVPDEIDLQRSREILDELYRRAGEFQRPPVEREYIRRLLRRF